MELKNIVTKSVRVSVLSWSGSIEQIPELMKFAPFSSKAEVNSTGMNVYVGDKKIKAGDYIVRYYNGSLEVVERDEFQERFQQNVD